MSLHAQRRDRVTGASEPRLDLAAHAVAETRLAGAAPAHAGPLGMPGSATPGPCNKTLVLVGGGHAHVEVLRRFARRRLPGIRVILISTTARMLYSGMLPGVIRGEYSLAQASIDLASLAHSAGAEMASGEATAIDLAARRITITGSEPIAFDLLSLNIGGKQAVRDTDGIAVKPIEPFISAWTQRERILSPNARVVVVGAGPAGVELTLALAVRYRDSGGRQSPDGHPGGIRLTLVGAQAEPLAGAPTRARRVVRDRLLTMGVSLASGVTATQAVNGGLQLSDNCFLQADAVIWAHGVTGPGLLVASGLACDRDGCVRVDGCLRSLSHPFVFASGDCAVLAEPRPKAGVWAVRAGGPLANNLRQAALGGRLRPWRPQRGALVVVGLGDGRAVGWRNGIAASGGWVWKWKDWIDRRWIGRYRPQGDAAPSEAGQTG